MCNNLHSMKRQRHQQRKTMLVNHSRTITLLLTLIAIITSCYGFITPSTTTSPINFPPTRKIISSSITLFSSTRKVEIETKAIRTKLLQELKNVEYERKEIERTIKEIEIRRRALNKVASIGRDRLEDLQQVQKSGNDGSGTGGGNALKAVTAAKRFLIETSSSSRSSSSNSNNNKLDTEIESLELELDQLKTKKQNELDTSNTIGTIGTIGGIVATLSVATNVLSAQQGIQEFGGGRDFGGIIGNYVSNLPSSSTSTTNTNSNNVVDMPYLDTKINVLERKVLQEELELKQLKKLVVDAEIQQRVKVAEQIQSKDEILLKQKLVEQSMTTRVNQLQSDNDQLRIKFNNKETAEDIETAARMKYEAIEKASDDYATSRINNDNNNNNNNMNNYNIYNQFNGFVEQVLKDGLVGTFKSLDTISQATAIIVTTAAAAAYQLIFNKNMKNKDGDNKNNDSNDMNDDDDDDDDDLYVKSKSSSNNNNNNNEDTSPSFSSFSSGTPQPPSPTAAAAAATVTTQSSLSTDNKSTTTASTGFGAPPKTTISPPPPAPFGSKKGFGAPPKRSGPPVGKRAQASEAAFGVPAKTKGSGLPVVKKNTAVSDSSSPFVGSPAGFGAPPKKSGGGGGAIPPPTQATFGIPPKTKGGERSKYSQNKWSPKTGKQTASPFGPGFGTSPKQGTSPPTKSAVAAKQSTSPFGSAGFGSSPKIDTAPTKTTNQAASPFGEGFGSSPKQGATSPTNSAAAAKQSTPPFGSENSKQAASPFRSGFGSSSKQGAPPPNNTATGGFGAFLKTGTGPPKSTAPGKQANSPFGVAKFGISPKQGAASASGEQTASSFGSGFDSASGEQTSSPFGSGLGTSSKIGSVTTDDAPSFGAKVGDNASPNQNRVRGIQAEPPFGFPPEAKDTRNEQNQKSSQNSIRSKMATSAYDGVTGFRPPSKTNPAQDNQPSSPFGNNNPNVGAKSTFGAPPKQSSMRNQLNQNDNGQMNKVDSSSFGVPSKDNQPSSPFGNDNPNVGAKSTFGAPPKKSSMRNELNQNDDSQMNKTKYSSFGAPSKDNQPSSPFGNNNQNFGVESTFGAPPKKSSMRNQLNQNDDSQMKKTDSFSFGVQSKSGPVQRGTAGVPSKNPFGASSSGGTSDNSNNNLNDAPGKKSSSPPFGVSSAGFGAGKQSSSPPIPKTSPNAGNNYGVPKKNNNSPKRVSSSFGTGFGPPPKQGAALPETGKEAVSPFGAGSVPKQGAAPLPMKTGRWSPKRATGTAPSKYTPPPGKQASSPFGGDFGAGATPTTDAANPSSVSMNQETSSFGGGFGATTTTDAANPSSVSTNQENSPFGAVFREGDANPSSVPTNQEENSPFGSRFGGPPKTGGRFGRPPTTDAAPPKNTFGAPPKSSMRSQLNQNKDDSEMKQKYTPSSFDAPPSKSGPAQRFGTEGGANDGSFGTPTSSRSNNDDNNPSLSPRQANSSFGSAGFNASPKTGGVYVGSSGVDNPNPNPTTSNNPAAMEQQQQQQQQQQHQHQQQQQQQSSRTAPKNDETSSFSFGTPSFPPPPKKTSSFSFGTPSFPPPPPSKEY